MAQRSARVLLEGNVVRSERNKGSMPSRENPQETVTWDFIEARVLTPEFDTVDVRFPVDGSVKVPAPDVRVWIRCEARASMGNVKITALEVLSDAAVVAA